MLEIKNTVTKMKNVFDELISRLDTVEERIFDLEDFTKQTWKTESQREKKGLKKENSEQNIQELCDNCKRHNILERGERGKNTRRNIWNNTENFSKLMSNAKL